MSNTLLNRASRNFLWQHPWQLTLAILGIALGVAVVIAIDLAIESSLSALDQTGKAFSGTASHQIVASDGGLDEKLYTHLKITQGFQRLSPQVKGYVQLPAQADTPFTLLGIDPFIEHNFQSIWQAPQGENKNPSFPWLTRLITEPNTVLLGEQTAKRLKLAINDVITLSTAQGMRQVTLIGVLPGSNPLLAKLLITDLATAQEVLGSLGRLSAIDVLFANDSIDNLTSLRAALPDDVLVVSTEHQSQAMREITRAFTVNLQAMGLLSLLVGMFLIYNTMTFLVLQRRRLIGNLRAMGVTRQQVFNLLLREALLLAILGASIGILLGIALGHGLLSLISGTINNLYVHSDATTLTISPQQLVKGLLLGITVAMLAVLAPALEATRVSPATVMIRSNLEKSVRHLVKVIGGLSTVFILAGLALAYFSGKSIILGLASVFILLFGFALLTPLFTVGCMHLLERTLGLFPGVLLRLPPRMVRAEMSRTGIAIAALTIAVSATIGMDLMIGSFRQTVSDWLQTTLRADFYVSLPGEKRPGASVAAAQNLKATLAKLPGVARLSSVLHTNVVAGNKLTTLSVFELNAQSKLGFMFKHQTDPQLWNRFEHANTVIITEPYAYHHALQKGDKLQLQTGQGPVDFTIIGIYADYSGDQGHITLSRTVYQQHWTDLGYSGIGIYAQPGANLERLEAAITQHLTGAQKVNAEQVIYDLSMSMFEQTFKITEALRWLSAIIAFIGVFSALMALQFERIRQLGILRAIGITPRQLSALITAETGLMGLAAGLFALPVGYIIAYVLIFVVYQRSFGWTMAFHFDARVIYQGLALAFISALLAGIFPALKMANTQPAEALRAE